MNYVIKRDGSRVPYTRERIVKAINGANNESTSQISEKDIEKIVDNIELKITDNRMIYNKNTEISVEDIQDLVENALMEYGYFEVAKKYITYRYKHMLRRESKRNLMETYKDILFTPAADIDDKRENANINTNTPMGIMLKLGTEGAKQFLSNILPEEFEKAHAECWIHQHDRDFSLITWNCCQIDLLKVFRGGFSTGHGHLREPNSIRSYSALACIVVQANQNDFYGGQSINCWDTAMAEGIKKTFKNAIIEQIALSFVYTWDLNNYDEIITLGRKFIDDFNIHYLGDKECEKEILELEYKIAKNMQNKLGGYYVFDENETPEILDRANRKTVEETHQAMEAAIHNFCSLHSRAGSQTPFSSINFGMDTTPEGRLAIKETLNAINSGLGNHETAIFPIAIFVIKDGINYKSGDPNYDLFKYACAVSAKRLYPNFLSQDATYNMKYYVPGNYNTYAASMGCADGDEVITYKYNDFIYCESLKRMWDRIQTETKFYNLSQYKILENIKVFDGKNKFVKAKTIIKNPDMQNWVSVEFTNGRSVLVTSDHPFYTKRGRIRTYELQLGDEIESCFESTIEENENKYLNIYSAYALGLIITDGNYSREVKISINLHNETDIMKKFIYCVNKAWNLDCRIIPNYRKDKGNYIDIRIKKSSKLAIYLKNIFGGNKKIEREIPQIIFNSSREIRLSFLAGMIDGDGHINHKSKVQLGSINKELSLQQLALAQSLGFASKMYKNKYNSKNKNKIRYRIEFSMNCDIQDFSGSYKKSFYQWNQKESKTISPEFVKITKIKFLGKLDKDSYDLETETDSFTLSFIKSGNCRTRVIANVNGPNETGGRGNFAFTTLNLPKYALEAKRILQNKPESFTEEDLINEFYKIYDKYIQIAHDYLLYRLQIIADKHAFNFPFSVGQGVWMGSEKLEPTDTIREILKHATYSIGFCGLAECLIVLHGNHHGANEKSQKLGLQIVQHLRDKTDEYLEKEKMNWSTFSTPAETVAGRLQKANRKEYGLIPGVTDKPYMTNSFHVPVYYKIRAIDKIRIEAPYHEMCNAGAISYIEMDGDPSQNLEAFETLVKAMHDANMGYYSINHPVDRDPVCGYTGIIKDECPHCHRKEHNKIKHLEMNMI